MIALRPLLVACGFMLLMSCDGPRENAGEKADQLANIGGSALGSGPNERLGELQDRATRDQKRAVDARADTLEDRADETRTQADQQADALERQAKEIRRAAKEQAKSLDQRAGLVRGK